MAGYQGGRILSTSEIMTHTPDWTDFVAGIRYIYDFVSFSFRRQIVHLSEEAGSIISRFLPCTIA